MNASAASGGCKRQLDAQLRKGHPGKLRSVPHRHDPNRLGRHSVEEPVGRHYDLAVRQIWKLRYHAARLREALQAAQDLFCACPETFGRRRIIGSDVGNRCEELCPTRRRESHLQRLLRSEQSVSLGQDTGEIVPFTLRNLPLATSQKEQQLALVLSVLVGFNAQQDGGCPPPLSNHDRLSGGSNALEGGRRVLA